MPRRAVPVFVWLLGVAVAVALSTAAVSMVGDRVSDRQVPIVSAAGVEDELADGSVLDVPTSSTVVGLVDPAVDPAVGPAVDPAVATSTTRGPVTSLPGPVAPGPSPLPAAAEPAPTTAAPPAPAPSPTTALGPPAAVPAEAVFTTVGGTVAVRCTASTIELRWATPAAGFGIDGTPKAGPTEVEVRFRGEEDEVRIRVTCEGGVPVEEIEQR